MIDQHKAVDAGRRVQEFLDDAAIKDALVRLEKTYFAEFKNSKTPAEREAIHARLGALNDLFRSALGTVDSGKLAQHQIAAQERAEAGKRTPRTR